MWSALDYGSLCFTDSPPLFYGHQIPIIINSNNNVWYNHSSQVQGNSPTPRLPVQGNIPVLPGRVPEIHLPTHNLKLISNNGS